MHKRIFSAGTPQEEEEPLTGEEFSPRRNNVFSPSGLSSPSKSFASPKSARRASTKVTLFQKIQQAITGKAVRANSSTPKFARGASTILSPKGSVLSPKGSLMSPKGGRGFAFPSSPDDDSVYEPSMGSLSLRSRIERFIWDYHISVIIDTINILLSITSSIIYVVDTYQSVSFSEMNTFQLVMNYFFIFDYAFKLALAQHPLTYIFSFHALMDVLTIVPTFLLLYNPSTVVNNPAITAASFLRVLRILKVSRAFDYMESEVNRQVGKIALIVVVLVFTTTGLIQIIENQWFGYQKYEFHDMFYFIMVTISTVGFGDISPQSDYGKVAIMALIVVAIGVLPKQANDLARLLSAKSIYARRSYSLTDRVPHVVITGNLTVPALNDILNELFHPDHGMQEKNAVLLNSHTPSAEMEHLLHVPQNEMTVHYIEGDALLEADLKRVIMDKAKASCIVCHKFVKNTAAEDSKTILNALAIKRYVQESRDKQRELLRKKYPGQDEKKLFANIPSTSIPVCLQLLRSESKLHYQLALSRVDPSDQIICIDEFKLSLMGKSCVCPGFITMISNLVCSSGSPPEEVSEIEWLTEYWEGRGKEIYRAALSPKFSGMSFSEVSNVAYKEFNVILFAVETKVLGETIIRLNPGDFILPDTFRNGVFGFVIADNKEAAEYLTSYEMTPAELEQLYLSNNFDEDKDVNSSVGRMRRPSFVKDQEYLREKILKLDRNQEQHAVEIGTSLEVEENYSMIDTKINQVNITHSSLAFNPSVTNHVIVCGFQTGLHHLILPLRAKYLPFFQPIVILTPEPIPDHIWTHICFFQQLYVVVGSALVEEDLKRANLMQADKAIILSDRFMDVEKKGPSSAEYILDADTIFKFKAIRRLNPDVHVLVELVNSSNISFLLPNETAAITFLRTYGPFMTPSFAAGEAYFSSIVDTLTCQTFYNPYIVSIIQQLIMGFAPEMKPEVYLAAKKQRLRQSNLFQMQVPRAFVGLTFRELYASLSIQRDIVPLGIYRQKKKSKGDPSKRYVITCPEPDTVMRSSDILFVLGLSIPEDVATQMFVRAESVIKRSPTVGRRISSPVVMKRHSQSIDEPLNEAEFESPDHTEPEILSARSNDSSVEELEGEGSRRASVEDGLVKKKPSKESVPLMSQRMQELNARLGKVKGEIGKFQQELQELKSVLSERDEIIVERVRACFREELLTLS